MTEMKRNAIFNFRTSSEQRFFFLTESSEQR